jgi:hypothetical protein
MDASPGSRATISQSGFQAAMGTLSVPKSLEGEVDKEMKKRDELGMLQCPGCRTPLKIAKDADPWMPRRCPKCSELFNPTPFAPMPVVPLIALFVSLIASAALSGFIIRSVTARAILSGTLAGCALVALIAQLAQGFPLAEALGAAFALDSASAESMFHAHYTPWIWATLLIIVLALGLLAVEYVHIRALRQKMKVRTQIAPPFIA